MRKLLILGRCDFVIFSHSVSKGGLKKGVSLSATPKYTVNYLC